MTMPTRKTVTSALALLAGLGFLASPALAQEVELLTTPNHWNDDEWSDEWWEKRAFQFEFIIEGIIDIVDPVGLAEIQLDQVNRGNIFAYTSIEGDYQREIGQDVPVTLSGEVELEVVGTAEGFIDIDHAEQTGTNPNSLTGFVGIAGSPGAEVPQITEQAPGSDGIAGSNGSELPLVVDGTATGIVELSGTATVNNGVEDATTQMGAVLGSSTAVANLGNIQTNAATYLDVTQVNKGHYVFAWAEAYDDCFDCGDGVRDMNGNDTGEMLALATRGSDFGRRLGGIETAVQLNATAVGNLLNVETIQVPAADDNGGVPGPSGNDTGTPVLATDLVRTDTGGLGRVVDLLLNGDVEPVLIADIYQANRADIYAVATSHQNLTGYNNLGMYDGLGLLDEDGMPMVGVVADLSAVAVGNLANISMGDFVDLDD